MDLSVVIINFNTKKLTLDCIKSVIRYTKKIKFEIIVVDNGSTDSSITAIWNIKLPITNFKLKIIENKKNLGFAKANNQGIKASRGRYVLLLNSDTLVNDDVLGEMVGWMDNHPKVGIVSCRLRNIDGSEQGTGGYFPTLIRVFSWMTIQDFPLVDRFIKPFHPIHRKFFNMGKEFYKSEKELDWVTGAFFLIRRQVVKDIGYFDENYFMYTEEVDFCYRAKQKAWKVFYLPRWDILHYGGASGINWSYAVPEYNGIKLFYQTHYPSWQFPILRIILKIGALGRIVLFGILYGKEAAKTYVESFKVA